MSYRLAMHAILLSNFDSLVVSLCKCYANMQSIQTAASGMSAWVVIYAKIEKSRHIESCSVSYN